MKLSYIKNVSTLKLIPSNCVGCSLCVIVCPHQILKLVDKRITVTDKDLCIECGACEKNCDFNAIEVNSGVGCASAIVNTLYLKK